MAGSHGKSRKSSETQRKKRVGMSGRQSPNKMSFERRMYAYQYMEECKDDIAAGKFDRKEWAAIANRVLKERHPEEFAGFKLTEPNVRTLAETLESKHGINFPSMNKAESLALAHQACAKKYGKAWGGSEGALLVEKMQALEERVDACAQAMLTLWGSLGFDPETLPTKIVDFVTDPISVVTD